MAYFFTKIIFFRPLKSLFLREIKGLCNIPKNKPFIITANHDSYLDPFFINAVVILYINKVVHFLSMKGRTYSWFGPIGAFVFKNWGQCVALEPTKKGKKRALAELLNLLKKGEPIALFPSGARSLSGKLSKGKTGAARLAITAKVPIIPVGLAGTYQLCPREKLIPKFKRIVKIRIGKPLYFNKYYNKKMNKKILSAITTAVMLEIARLAGKKYLYR